MDGVEPASREPAAASRQTPLPGRVPVRWLDSLCLCGLAVLVLATYAPVYTQTYLATDDYAITEGAPAGYFLACGRPLQGLAYRLLPRAPDSLDGFRLFRLVATLGVVALATLLWYRLARLIPDKLTRLLAVVAIAALPPLQIVVAWVCCWPFVFGALLAGLSACLVLDSGRATLQPLGDAFRLAAAAGLHVAALCVYQPAGMWFWTIVLIDALGAGTRSAGLWEPKQFRRMSIVLACGLAHIALYYLLIRGWQSAADVEMIGRGAATDDPLAKLVWFVNKPLVYGLSGWNLYQPFWFAFAAVPLLATGTGFAVRRQFLELRRRGCSARNAIGRVAAQAYWIAGLIPLAYLPNLAVAESAPSCRSEMALGTSLAVLLIWAVGVLIHRSHLSSVTRRFARCGAGLFCLAALIAARLNVVETIILPQQREYQFVVDSLDAQARPEVARIHMICPRGLVLSGRQRHDEFGIPSSATSWGAAGMLRIALRERGWQAPPQATFSAQPIDTHDKSVLVVDLTKVMSDQ